MLLLELGTLNLGHLLVVPRPGQLGRSLVGIQSSPAATGKSEGLAWDTIARYAYHQRRGCVAPGQSALKPILFHGSWPEPIADDCMVVV